MQQQLKRYKKNFIIKNLFIHFVQLHVALTSETLGNKILCMKMFDIEMKKDEQRIELKTNVIIYIYIYDILTQTWKAYSSR